MSRQTMFLLTQRGFHSFTTMVWVTITISGWHRGIDLNRHGPASTGLSFTPTLKKSPASIS